MLDPNAAVVREALSGDLAELHGGMDKLAREVHEIHEALTGNGLGVSHGLIGCVQRLEAGHEQLRCQVAEIEHRWQRVKWAAVGIALGSGFGGAGLATVLLKAVG